MRSWRERTVVEKALDLGRVHGRRHEVGEVSRHVVRPDLEKFQVSRGTSALERDDVEE